MWWSLPGVLQYPLEQHKQVIIDKLREQNIRPLPFPLAELRYLPSRPKIICTLRYNNVPYNEIITLLDLPGPSTLVTAIKLAARMFYSLSTSEYPPL